jgi:L-ascorbate metabolism protein UlaG (beta-lactamase superfamily)
MKKTAVVLWALLAIACWAQDPGSPAARSLAGGVEERPVQTIPAAKGDIKITPVRHASFVLEYGGKVIQVDPWSQGNFAGLPQADLILITDIHPDHLDPKAIEPLKKAGTAILAPPAVKEKLPEAEALKNGETKMWEGIRIEAVPMYNLVRGPNAETRYHDKGRGNGYVLTVGGKRIYIAGDTECIPEMKALKNIDVAFVPMNLPYTMPPEEAAACVKTFRPKVVYPYHYRGSDLKVFENALKDEKGIEVRSLNWYY